MNIKEKLKKSKKFMRAYYKLLPLYCRFFTKSAVKMLYKQTFQKKLDLKNPRDFNEKIQWLKVYKYKKDKLVIKCADKYRVREYVKDCGCEEILNELYKVYFNYNEFNLNELPDKFVLKLNRGAGYNLICSDKANIKEKEIKNTIKKWFKAECGERFCELHYRRAKPCVVCEKYLCSEDGAYPVDYKVYTFNGKACLVEICLDRKEGVKFIHVGLDYKKLDFTVDDIEEKYLPKKPKCFESMISYAERLAKPFCHVRVDFYVVDEKPILGEMTFTNSGGYDHYFNQKALDYMGDRLLLPSKR